MSFADGNPAFNYTVPSHPDATFDNASTMGATMEEFFSRPVKIHEFEWSSSVNGFSTFLPWKLFFENPRVANRITNYHLLRCKLNVKFLINGTPFQYGRLLADYIPLRSAAGPPDALTVDRAFITQDSVAASQRPHIFLDPTTCSGGELELPFFWYKDYLNVVEGDWDLMGEINIRELNPLRSAHPGSFTETVRITVMAWASEVSVAMPTSVNASGLTSQSEPEYEFQAKGKGKGKDEYPKSGIISGPATAIQNVASALTKVPFLAPYARASEVAAGAVANIARMFGYSRPVQQAEGIGEYRPAAVGSMALTNIPDNTNKLALDVKQETTVDSRTIGLDGTDEMNIKSIAMRESYVTKFTWTQNDSANAGDVPETLLWSSHVTPMMFDIEDEVRPMPESYTAQWYHFTPSGFVANLFDSWHGSMTFRFQIVASKFHRGRLRIVYEPSNANPGATFAEYNINYSKIVDISEERDVVLTIGHGQDKYWLTTGYPNATGTLDNTPFATGTLPTYFDTDATNGNISVYVLNDLEVPDPSSGPLQDIEINVYTHMNEDFEVMDPSGSTLHNMTFFLPQSTPEYDPMRQFSSLERQADGMRINSILSDLRRERMRDVMATQPPLNVNAFLAASRAIEAQLNGMSDDDLREEWVYYHIRDYYLSQSTPETEGENTDEVCCDGNEPERPESYDLVPNIVKPEYAMALPGEAVKSLRTILKRYDYHRSEAGNTFNVGRWNRLTSNDFPFLRGSAPSPISSNTAFPFSWNFCNFTHINYIAAAFSGYRGGIRWKVIPGAGAYRDANMAFSVCRSSLFLSYGMDTIVAGSVDNFSQDAITYAKTNWLSNGVLLAGGGIGGSRLPGSTAGHSLVNPCFEFELPYYMRTKFVPKLANYTAGTDFCRYHNVFFDDTNNTTNSNNYDFYVAGGDDFSCFFFTGLPRVLFTNSADGNEATPDFP